MSTYNSILVPISDGPSGQKPLEAAIRLAKAFSGHVVGMHVRVDQDRLVPVLGEMTASPALYDQITTGVAEHVAARAEAAKKMFDETCASAGVTLASTPPAPGVSAEWVDVAGDEESLVASRDRLADLLVIPRLARSGEAHSAAVYSVLAERGRPVLVVPPALPQTIGENVVIAWDGSSEAYRAAVAALPLLENAKTVTIATVGEHVDQPKMQPEDLASYLGWHHVNARCLTIPRDATHGKDVPACLAETCKELGADILVAGAFTHSRWREEIIGGVTRYLLHDAETPCLLCH